MLHTNTKEYSKSYLLNYGENVAAISAMLHEDSQGFRNIIEKVGDKICGSAGIWDLCATAARIFTEESDAYIPGEKYYWYEAIENFSIRIHDLLSHGEIPDEAHMHLLAGGSIELNFI